MEKLKKTFGERPLSMSLVLAAVVLGVLAAFSGTEGASLASTSCLTGAIIFGFFFDL
jgi:hypothetical protein